MYKALSGAIHMISFGASWNGIPNIFDSVFSLQCWMNNFDEFA